MYEEKYKDYSKEAEKIVKKAVKAFTDAAFESYTINESYHFSMNSSSYFDFDIFKFEEGGQVTYFEETIMGHHFSRSPILEKWQYKQLEIKCNSILEAVKKYRAENHKIKKQKS